METRPHLEVAVLDDPDPADLDLLDDRVNASTVAATGHDNLRLLAVMARDPQQHLVAGVHGWTWGGCCEVVCLWVDEAHRGRRLGSALLAAAEDEAARRGCHQVVLFTHTTVPEFYTHRGYEVVGRLEDYPSGTTAHWFRKGLRTSPSEPHAAPHEAPNELGGFKPANHPVRVMRPPGGSP